MRSIIDWLLDQMRFTDEEHEESESEAESEMTEKTVMESVLWKKEQQSAGNSRVFFKNIELYDDVTAIIDSYKKGVVCIFRLNAYENADAQGMLNYICGGIYALDGNITNISGNVYLAVHSSEKIQKNEESVRQDQECKA
ncbi:MAG: cell division protein SepF [Lachnospiraceae bacterium]|nr:cell division protein SepF [Lachnospiraceae bacterium]